MSDGVIGRRRSIHETAYHFCLGLAAALAVTSAASAQVMLDLTKVTCDQFIKYKVADPKLIAVWLSGYFHGKRGDTIVDTQKAECRCRGAALRES
jgi:acid stress chaperone HdeB